MTRFSSHERGDGVDLPGWWLDRVNEMRELRGDTITELGKLLAEVVGRANAFDHGTVSRFLNNKVTTRQLTDAFVKLYGIPSPHLAARADIPADAQGPRLDVLRDLLAVNRVHRKR